MHLIKNHKEKKMDEAIEREVENEEQVPLEQTLVEMEEDIPEGYEFEEEPEVIGIDVHERVKMKDGLV